jgi:hypothetical protein
VTKASVPPDVERFIDRNIESVEQLEVLLLLHHSADRFWSVDQVASELGLSPISTAPILDQLCARNLLDVKTTSDVMFCFKPTSDELRRGTKQLADAYRVARLAVLGKVAGRSRSAVRDFAAAFKLTKDDDNG